MTAYWRQWDKSDLDSWQGKDDTSSCHDDDDIYLCQDTDHDDDQNDDQDECTGDMMEDLGLSDRDFM